MERHLPLPKERNVGNKSGSEKRLFSPAAVRINKTIHSYANWQPPFSNGRSMLRTEHSPLPLDESHGSLLKKVETRGHSSFYLFGRHSNFGKVSIPGPETHSQSTAGFKGKWYDSKCGQIGPRPFSKCTTPGFYDKLGPGQTGSSSSETEKYKEVTGKIHYRPHVFLQKSGSNSGAGSLISHSAAPLRAFTDLLVNFTNQAVQLGWDTPIPLSQELKSQVKEVGSILKTWEGRTFQGNASVRKIHSDSSDFGWGAIDLNSGRCLQEFWRSEKGLHINVKELRAAISAVQGLAKPGEVVHLAVDNQVAYSYLKRGGGRCPHFNEILRPFLVWCPEKKIVLNPNWVKSEDMLADGLSRWSYDKGDYTLDKKLFHRILKIFQSSDFSPLVDMFASPGNKQLDNFVSRWPHSEATAINALETSLCPFQKVYANPPWNLIFPWLQRLWTNPHLTCLTTVPLWVGSPWWPLLTRLHVRKTPVVVVRPRWGMFKNSLEEDMPPTKWPLLCLLLSGKHYKENKFHLKTSIYI